MSGMQLSEDEWRQRLTPEQYEVLRQKATEVHFTGELLNEDRPGVFSCAACGSRLFTSDTKYESKIPGLMGWPSFSEVVSGDAVELVNDVSHGMQRLEVVCKTCGSHLGHLFDDASASTGKHYCINSTSLAFQPQKPPASSSSAAAKPVQ